MNPSPTPGAPLLRASPGPTLLVLFALLAGTLAVYAPVFRYEFLETGDREALLGTAAVSPGLTSETLGLLGRTTGRDGDQPLARLSHLVIAELFGPGAGAAHVANVLLHALAAGLVFLGLARATRARGPAAFAALVFALHPLAVESVAWAAMRGRVLGALFFAAALYAYPFRRRGAIARSCAFLVLFACGLAAHPAMAGLPLLLLALELLPFGSTERRADLRASRPLTWIASVMGLAAIAWSWVSAAPAAPGALDRVAALPLGLLATLRRVFLPFGLAHAYPHPALDAEAGVSLLEAGLAWGVLLVVGIATVRLARRAPFFAAGALAFAGPWLVSALLPYGVGLGEDRHAYLALPGLALAVALGARERFGTRPGLQRVLAPAAVVLLALATLGARAQVVTWRDDASLHARALAVTERNAEALLGRALDLERRGKLTLAEDHANRALEIRPDDPDAHALLGRIAFLRATGAGGQPDPRLLDTAQDHLERALSLAPDHVRSHHDLGQVFQHRGGEENLAAAERHFDAAVAAAPWSAADHTRKGMVEIGRREHALARESFRRALALDPAGEADAWYGLGLAEYELAGTDVALEVFTDGLAVEPDHSGILTSRGRTYLERGDRESARADLVRAIQVHPGFADALFEYAQLLELEGETAEALLYYERTLARRPTHVRANVNAAWLHAAKEDFGSARSRALAALALNPDRTDAHHLLAKLQTDAGAWRSALQHYRRALRVEPQRLDLRAELALLLAAAGGEEARDPENALALASECVTATQGRNPVALEAHAAALAALARYEEAAREQERAVALLPEAERAEATSRLELYRSGRPLRLEARADARSGGGE